MSLIIKMQVDIDCDDLSCIYFTDVTKEYSVNNPTGYGGPNVPISEIASVDISLTINGITYAYLGAGGYLPTAGGSNSICLKAADFVNGSNSLVYEKGGVYTIEYCVNLDDSSSSVCADGQDFIFPCCGDAITSNLGTNFTITEKLGCSSLDFKDTTGTYSLSNPGGYGSPNPQYSDIDSTLIKITLADGTVKEIIDFIPTALNQVKNINASALGYGDGIVPPQVVSIEYSVYAAGGCRIGYKKIKVLLHCALRNCIVSKGKSTLVTNCGSCTNGEVQVTISLIHRYEMLLLASYDNIDCIQNEVDALYEECKKYCGC